MLGQVYSYLKESYEFRSHDTLSTNYIRVMRLRILWMVICGTVERPPTSYSTERVTANSHGASAILYIKKQQYDVELRTLGNHPVHMSLSYSGA